MNQTIFQSDSKYLLKSKFFSVEETGFTLEDTKQKVHTLVERLPTVNIFPISDKGEIYLVNEYRDFFGKKILSAVAGFMDIDGESSLDAAKREVNGKLGITAFHWEELLKVEIGASVIKATEYLFLAKDLEVGRPNEHIELITISLRKAMEKVLTGEIFISSCIIGILLLNSLYKEGKI